MDTPDPSDPFDHLVEEALRTQPVSKEPAPALRDRLRVIEEYLAAGSPPAGFSGLVYRDPQAAMQFLPIEREVTVGRDAACELAFPADQRLSRRHFSIRAEEGFLILRDEGSRNGTFVNGQPEAVRERVLRDGDLITAGQRAFLFSDSRRDP